MKVNLNDRASVRLTPQGLAAWVRYRESVMAMFDPEGADYHRKHFNMPDADGVLREQLWVLFNVFGALMYNGGPNMFVDNVVDIEAVVAPCDHAKCAARAEQAVQDFIAGVLA